MHFYYLHFPVVFIVSCLGYIFDDCSITLIRGGDVELNPGPNSGETERCSVVKQISFCHLNIHSLLARGDCGSPLDHLYNLVSDNNYDVIALSETLLSDAINDDEICMEGYEVFRLDRTRHGGEGVSPFIVVPSYNVRSCQHSILMALKCYGSKLLLMVKELFLVYVIGHQIKQPMNALSFWMECMQPSTSTTDVRFGIQIIEIVNWV